MKKYAILLSAASWILALVGIVSVAITAPWKHSAACCLTDAILMVAILLLAYLNERLAIHALHVIAQTKWVVLGKLADTTKAMIEQERKK